MQTTLAPIAVDLGDGERLSMLHRPGTRDRYTIEENWTKHPYRLSRHKGVERRMFIEETYRRLLDTGRTPLILDRGANIGASALALRLYYPEAEIVAVEPEPGNFDLLFRNTFKPARVTCVRAAAASFDGEVSLFDPGRSTDAYRTGAAGGAALGATPAISVPTLLSQTKAALPGEDRHRGRRGRTVLGQHRLGRPLPGHRHRTPRLDAAGQRNNGIRIDHALLSPQAAAARTRP